MVKTAREHTILSTLQFNEQIMILKNHINKINNKQLISLKIKIWKIKLVKVTEHSFRELKAFYIHPLEGQVS